MSVRFELGLPVDVRFGRGRVTEVAPAVVRFGVTRALLVTGRTATRADGVRAALAAEGVATVDLAVAGEPTVELVRGGVARARDAGCDGVVAVGGGSVLDAAKAIAVLLRSGSDPLDHLEVVGRGLQPAVPGVPCVAVPTTAGTGSEVTRNAVLTHAGVKASLRGPLVLPRLAIVDPDLLADLPPAVVAAGGSDALAQLVEPFLSHRANPFTDALARDGIRRSARSLRRAVECGLADAPDLREDLALASLFGGLCLAGAGLGVVHGFAGVVGGRLGAPHGEVCAALLAPALRVNARVLADRAPGHPALARVAEVAALVTGVPEATAADGVTWLQELRTALRIPGLAAHGLTDGDVPELVAGAARASSTKGNPVELSPGELTEILRAAS